MRDITVGVVARDRFSTAKRCLSRLLKATPEPFRLVIVDAGAPKHYRRQMERAVAKRPNVEFLTTDRYINPNAAKNWVVRETRGTEFLALIENDNLVSPGWLSALIRACDEDGAEVARPMLFERRLGYEFPHFDRRWEDIETVDTPEGPGIRFRARATPLTADIGAARRRTHVLEVHCVLYRESVFDKIGEFDERINTRQELDVALQLYAANVPIVFEPAAEVTYISPPPVRRDERAFYNFRWNVDEAVRSHELINQKWNVVNLPRSVDFVINRQRFASYGRYLPFFLRWEFEPIARAKVYNWAEQLPSRLRKPLQRALYS
jgi:GT2 family glycosyltransferase